MKAIVHIGLPKAGSTTIQSFLHANAPALAAQGFAYRRQNAGDVCQREYLSVIFRDTGLRFADPLQNLAAGTPDAAATTARALAFERWLDGALARASGDTWLISNEFLSARFLGEAGSRAFHDWASARFDGVRYVLYLRRQDDWLASYYSQCLRDGLSESFDACAARVPARDYDALVALWERVAGADALEVRLLERGALAGGDLVADYCAATGIDATGLSRPPARNLSLSRRSARALRGWNALLGRALPRHTTASRAARKAARLVLDTPLFAGPSLGLAPEARAAYMAPVAASNDTLRARRFPGRATLFEERDRAAPGGARAARAARPALETSGDA